jgi:hypothetical protein
MIGTLSQNVDHKFVKHALGYIRASGDHEKTVIDRLEALRSHLQRVSADLETSKAKHYAGPTPAEKREQLGKIAKELKGIAGTLEFLEAPQRRYKSDRKTPPTRPTGLTEFRHAMADQLTEVISADYLRRFAVEPLQWDPTNVSLGPINTYNRAFAIALGAEFIVADLLNEIALGMESAARKIAENTKLGRRDSPIGETLLLNLVALWEETHQRKTPSTYSGGETKFFKFCNALSRSIGLGSLCTKTTLAAAVQEYNEKFFPGTTPKNDPSTS